ncbi:MAG TPA: hypothetical protein VGK23_08635 [Methanomassiliicoccales archaeon]|jgi:hypothetical protein
MDWNAAGPWKIEDLDGNSLVVSKDLELAYFKATSLIYASTKLWEISPDEYVVVLEDGTVVNTIKKNVQE